MKMTIRQLFRIVTMLPFLQLVLCAAGATPPAKHQYLVYVGTYTKPETTKSKGIYGYRLNADTAQVTPLGVMAETVNPSFVAVHPNRRFLYAVNEVTDYKGQSSGVVSAFAIDEASGKLTLLNEVPSRGADPCYVSLDKDGKHVLVANYTGGNIAVFPVCVRTISTARLSLSCARRSANLRSTIRCSISPSVLRSRCKRLPSSVWGRGPA